MVCGSTATMASLTISGIPATVSSFVPATHFISLLFIEESFVYGELCLFAYLSMPATEHATDFIEL